ncbi:MULTISPECIES: chromate transporter [Alicyclobacillus]|uniref:Chromate transporter n=2 Tax=Alicyclobacillus tolerans TaxID=90970 RepID=A0ABT9LYZ2_9BACL|nr:MULTISPECIES: chromate transporter [Alicyclobacillus]MDP9729481.1 chromate transporter [Alicyclobacillus tengchongensis]SHK28586.1 chromate transporter [Alicyclobacillus montanus]
MVEKKGNLRELMTAMLRVGIVGYGGGPATMTLFRYEAVTRYQWLDDSEFAEILALANTLPGPMATKMAAYFGFRIGGWLGALLGVLAHILPSTLLVVLFFGIINHYRSYHAVRLMIAAVNPVISVLLGMLAYDFTRKSIQSLRWPAAFLGVLAALGCLLWLRIPDAVVVLAFLAFGALIGQTGKLSRWMDKSGSAKGGKDV